MKRREVDVLIVEDQESDAELVLRALYVHVPDLTAAIAATGSSALQYLILRKHRFSTCSFQIWMDANC